MGLVRMVISLTVSRQGLSSATPLEDHGSNRIAGCREVLC